MQLTNIEEYHLSVPLKELFPHCCEYLVRFGWMPGGKAVWIQLLNRQQQHLILAVLDTNSFVSSRIEEGSSSFPDIFILFEEKSTTWVSVSSLPLLFVYKDVWQLV